MKRFAALLFVVLVAVAPARAAVVYDGYPTGPGGLSTPYPAVNPEVYAGFIELNYGGATLLAMSDDYNARINVGSQWTAHYYTYADVMAGAPVRFSPDRYSPVAWDRSGDTFRIWDGLYGTGGTSLSLEDQLRLAATIYPDIPAGLATMNQAVWLGMNPSLSFPEWPYGPGCWGPGGLYDVSYSYCSLEVRTYDWSNDFIVATLTTPTGTYVDEYLIPIAGQNFTIANAPLPPAFWLLGSGLLGLAGVARKRHGAPR